MKKRKRAEQNRTRGKKNPKVVTREQKKNACLKLAERASRCQSTRGVVDSPPKWALAGEARSERGIDDKKPGHSTTVDVSTKESNASE